MSRLQCFLPIFLVLVIGCGRSKVEYPTAPVAGVAMYHGKPLAGGNVIFFHPSGQAVACELSSDGTFRLEAFQGKNQVAIQIFSKEEPKVSSNGRFRLPANSLVPLRYTEPETSGLTVDVKPNGMNDVKFVLED